MPCIQPNKTDEFGNLIKENSILGLIHPPPPPGKINTKLTKTEDIMIDLVKNSIKCDEDGEPVLRSRMFENSHAIPPKAPPSDNNTIMNELRQINLNLREIIEILYRTDKKI